MARFDSVGSFLRILTVFFVYSVAVQASEAVVDSSYLHVGVALLVTLVVVLAIDAIPALIRGQTPSFGEGSYFYSGRGILTVIGFILLAAVFADGLRANAAFSEGLAVFIGAVGSAVFVFGSLVAYYWRRQSRATHA